MSEESNPDQIAILKKLRLYEMTNMLVGEVAKENAAVEQLSLGARNYLIKSGISYENIEKLINRLTKQFYENE